MSLIFSLVAGVAVFGLVASIDGTLFSETLVKVRSKKFPNMPHHRFRPGDIVTLCRKSPVEGNVIEASVAEKQKTHLLLCMAKEDVPKDLQHGAWVRAARR